MEKKFNSNIILDDDGKSVQHVQAVLTGILSLDCAIGSGGYAKEKDVL
nr:DNA recombination/repair protein RecA [Lactococcus lactis]